MCVLEPVLLTEQRLLTWCFRSGSIWLLLSQGRLVPTGCPSVFGAVAAGAVAAGAMAAGAMAAGAVAAGAVGAGAMAAGAVAAGAVAAGAVAAGAMAAGAVGAGAVAAGAVAAGAVAAGAVAAGAMAAGAVGAGAVAAYMFEVKSLLLTIKCCCVGAQTPIAHSQFVSVREASLLQPSPQSCRLQSFADGSCCKVDALLLHRPPKIRGGQPTVGQARPHQYAVHPEATLKCMCLQK